MECDILTEYDELVKSLRICSRCDFGQDCNGCTQKSDDAFCCDKLLHEAADAIEELIVERDAYCRAMTDEHNTAARLMWEYRWIPVEERLPKPETDVLSFRIYGSFSQISEVIINEMKKNGEWCYEGVTHWMPLPEPPKDGEE